MSNCPYLVTNKTLTVTAKVPERVIYTHLPISHSTYVYLEWTPTRLSA